MGMPVLMSHSWPLIFLCFPLIEQHSLWYQIQVRWGLYDSHCKSRRVGSLVFCGETSQVWQFPGLLWNALLQKAKSRRSFCLGLLHALVCVVCDSCCPEGKKYRFNLFCRPLIWHVVYHWNDCIQLIYAVETVQENNAGVFFLFLLFPLIWVLPGVDYCWSFM